MTLTQALANFGFFAEATATKPQVSGAARIGDASLKKEWADADIAHAFKVVATAAGDVVTLTLSSGLLVAGAGDTPTITGGDGKDFEGVTLPTLATLYGLQIRAKGTTGHVAVASTLAKLPDVDELEYGDTVVFQSDSGVTIASGTVSFTIETAGDWVEVVVIGKS